jgi:hypothetical protein
VRHWNAIVKSMQHSKEEIVEKITDPDAQQD